MTKNNKQNRKQQQRVHFQFIENDTQAKDQEDERMKHTHSETCTNLEALFNAIDILFLYGRKMSIQDS